MSCKECEEKPITTYVRVGNGNVQINGCIEHLRMLIDQLRVSKISVKDIVDAYITEAKNYDFFSDPQRAYINEDGKIVVCLREYNWYITKEPITDILECFKALIEIDFICEYDEGDDFERIKYSKYWNKN